MITETTLSRLLDRPETGRPVLSLYLDVAPGPDNRRSHAVFLAQQRTRAAELLAAWPGADRRDLEALLDRAARWVADELDPASHGAAIFAEVGGAWWEPLQLPLGFANFASVDAKPAVAPLVRALQGQRKHAVALVDREHLRLISVWLGRAVEEEHVRKEPNPAHDGSAGGFDQQHQQRRRLAEEQRFFTEFATALACFAMRTAADDVVLLGTDENVARFRRLLPADVAALVSCTGHAAVDAPTGEVLDRVARLECEEDPEGTELLARLRHRAGTGRRATTGVQPTLSALQAGGVEAVVLGQDEAPHASRCTHCGFLFARQLAACPYDGVPTETGAPVVEEALRLAVAQGAAIRVLPPEEAAEFAGAGALLRF